MKKYSVYRADRLQAQQLAVVIKARGSLLALLHSIALSKKNNPSVHELMLVKTNRKLITKNYISPSNYNN